MLTSSMFLYRESASSSAFISVSACSPAASSAVLRDVTSLVKASISFLASAASSLAASAAAISALPSVALDSRSLTVFWSWLTCSSRSAMVASWSVFSCRRCWPSTTPLPAH